MAECFGCGEKYKAPAGEAWMCIYKNQRVGVCATCRRHLEIGRLVEGMPKQSRLDRDGKTWEFKKWDSPNDEALFEVEAKTALEALRKAAGEVKG